MIDNLLSEKNSRLTFNDLKVVLKVYLESCQAFKVEFLPKIAAENKYFRKKKINLSCLIGVLTHLSEYVHPWYINRVISGFFKNLKIQTY